MPGTFRLVYVVFANSLTLNIVKKSKHFICFYNFCRFMQLKVEKLKKVTDLKRKTNDFDKLYFRS